MNRLTCFCDSFRLRTSTPSKSDVNKDLVPVITAIKHNWLDQKNLELQRLQKQLPSEYRAVLQKFGDEDETVLIVFLRALEILKAVEKTHYGFFHSQSQSVFSLAYFIKQFVLATDSSKPSKYRQYFRIPASIENCPKTVDAFFQKYDQIDDNALHTELLSVSGYPLSTTVWESAYSLFKMNTQDVMHPHNFKAVLQAIYSNETQLNAVVTGLHAINQTRVSDRGVLQLILIPKNKAKNITYNSHPFGRPNRVFSFFELTMQQKLYRSIFNTDQYRLLSAGVQDEKTNALVVRIDGRTKGERRDHRLKIRGLFNANWPAK